MSKVSNNARLACLVDWLKAYVPNAFKARAPRKHIEQGEEFQKMKHL